MALLCRWALRRYPGGGAAVEETEAADGDAAVKEVNLVDGRIQRASRWIRVKHQTSAARFQNKTEAVNM